MGQVLGQGSCFAGVTLDDAGWLRIQAAIDRMLQADPG
jgi:hypothetical protein